MFDRSAASLIAKIPDGMPTTNPAIQVDRCGVLNLGWTAENSFGNSRSRDMAYQIRACPYWKTSSDEIIPVNAPITIIDRDHRLAPSTFRAYATGASAASPETNVVYFIMPSSTTATPTYSSVQITSDAMIPNGRSRCGRRHSSAAVETESNPIYVKKTIAPPVTIPPNPEGANGVQFAGLTSMPPTTRNVRIAPILIATITLLASADSRTPRTRSSVSRNTIRNPGRLKYAPVQCPEAHTGLAHFSGRLIPNAANCAFE